MKTVLIVAAIVGAYVMTACAASSTLPPNPSRTQTSITLGDDVLVMYHKSGGIAGIDETLVVHQGGLLELTARGGGTKSVQAAEPQIQFVRRMLEQKDFGELESSYQAAGADLFTYTITARDANGYPKTVTTMDAAPTPPYLGQLIAMLEQLRAQVK